MAYQAPITIKQVLERIHRHDYVLPAIQREFVWEPDQVCRLFDIDRSDIRVNTVGDRNCGVIALIAAGACRGASAAAAAPGEQEQRCSGDQAVAA